MSIKNTINKMIKHSDLIIKNNNWENTDFDIDCRSYEEGYKQACKDILNKIISNKGERI